jgi:peroxiredoxin
MTEVTLGNRLKHLELLTILGEPVQIPEPERLVHLQFRRYAGCPICNMHLRSVSQRHEEILAAGIREVVVFHSSAETMLEFQGELPFAVIADPAKKLYAEFGVESSLKAVLNPPAPLAGFRARSVVHSVRGVMGIGEKHLGLPADFLIAPRRPGPGGKARQLRKRPVVRPRTARPRQAPPPTARRARHDAHLRSDASVSKNVAQQGPRRTRTALERGAHLRGLRDHARRPPRSCPRILCRRCRNVGDPPGTVSPIRLPRLPRAQAITSHPSLVLGTETSRLPVHGGCFLPFLHPRRQANRWLP